MRVPVVVVAVAVAAAIGACSRDVAGPRAASRSVVRRASLQSEAAAQLAMVAQGRLSGPEDRLLSLESRIPGFGGLYFDGATKQFVVYLKDLSQSAAANGELRRFADTVRADANVHTKLGQSGGTRLVQAKFSMSELVAGRTLFFQGARVSGLIAIDADERLNRVRVGVAAGTNVSAIADHLVSLGLPDSLFVFEYIAHPALATTTLRDSVRATGSGVQITSRNGLSGRCTLGANVTTLTWNETGFLTAGHCDPNAIGSGSTGDTIFQNTYQTSRHIGTVFLNPPYNLAYPAYPNCDSIVVCTNADVMFVKSIDSTHNWSKRVAVTTADGVNSALGSITFNSASPGPMWWPLITPAPWTYVGMPAHKVGRTTGWTSGFIGATCEDITVNGGTLRLLCMDRVDSAAVGGGDSGSLVFYPPFGNLATDTVYAIGILSTMDTANTFDSGDSSIYCKSPRVCRYWYTNWDAIHYHLGRYFTP